MNINRIIPATFEIRNFLKKQLSKEDEANFLKKVGLKPEDYTVLIETGRITIINKKEDEKYRIEEMQRKEAFFKDIASKMNKSIIWIYQELVISGYGEYISENSNMYQAALLAYEYEKEILKIHNEETVKQFEDSHILSGTLYEEELKYKQYVSPERKRSKKKWII